MRSRPLLLALALAAACGGNSSPNTAGKCPQTPCASNQTCQADGTCIAAISTPDGGTVPTCAASQKPVVATEAAQLGPSWSVQALGQQKVGTPVQFSVPVNAIAIEIVEQAVSAPDAIQYQFSASNVQVIPNISVPRSVTGADGQTWYDDLQSLPADGSGSLAFYAGGASATGTLTIPNTSRALALAGNLPAGAWSLVVGDYAYECTLAPGVCPSGATNQSVYDVSVVVKTAPSPALPASGAFDVNVYFATTVAPDDTGANQPLSATAANTGADPDLKNMENAYRAFLKNAGVTVGTFTYTLLDAATLATYASGIDADAEGACAPLSQLLKLAPHGNTMNVFFVSRYTSSSTPAGYVVVGLDGTIPGPSTYGGTVASGVSASTQDLRAGRTSCGKTPPDLVHCGAEQTAYFIAHETGHFLGLYHTTEFDGTAFDPLSGTPTCPCSSCGKLATGEVCGTPTSSSQTSHAMTNSECLASSQCGGGDNLMFWAVSAQSTAALTGDQGQVIRANPLVH